LCSGKARAGVGAWQCWHVQARSNGQEEVRPPGKGRPHLKNHLVHKHAAKRQGGGGVGWGEADKNKHPRLPSRLGSSFNVKVAYQIGIDGQHGQRQQPDQGGQAWTVDEGAHNGRVGCEVQAAGQGPGARGQGARGQGATDASSTQGCTLHASHSARYPTLDHSIPRSCVPHSLPHKGHH
jgi:hypothetical protein